MDRSTLSREVAPLIASGLVDGGKDAHDSRKRVLSLSPVGSARLAEARPLWEQAQADFATAFGAERTAGLVQELHDVIGAG